MTGTLPTSLKGAPVTDLSGSAQLVTAMLAASDARRGAPLRPLLVTGQTFACPAAIEDDLIAFCAARGALVRTEALQAHPGLRIVRGNGNFGPRTRVTLATEYFMTGRARVLVGTRALLGEGWDCAAVNVTVDLTSATTPGAITQMRGRALRRDPADGDKVADNWSVCCVSPDHPRGDADYLRLVRKHDAYFAVSPQGLIESGVTHCDPYLSPYGPPPADAGITARALQRVAERGQARAWWRIGEPYQGTDVATIRIRSPALPGRRRTRHPGFGPGPVVAGAAQFAAGGQGRRRRRVPGRRGRRRRVRRHQSWPARRGRHRRWRHRDQRRGAGGCCPSPKPSTGPRTQRSRAAGRRRRGRCGPPAAPTEDPTRCESPWIPTAGSAANSAGCPPSSRTGSPPPSTSYSPR
ncbi:hypothetical protein LAUMK13_03986 [Mycobacterium innocens]|uniref:Helicase C-terminal domain-containing protein n=1 Tax=Mycobacterium innocens TaxID=2341083 RepID=A0A498QFI7_9MYCO|nr:hypothetical protein LAUMK13_03986 [Mycobacterium innocens]